MFKSNFFDEIWFVDTEFNSEPGRNVAPVCLVAKELISNKLIRVWQDELLQMTHPPYDVGQRSLFVAYFAVAELSCHLVLNWPTPKQILDLWVEFRNTTNGIVGRNQTSLIKALQYFGLNSIGATEKQAMHKLILDGGPWSDQQQKQILDYCQTDVEALPLLLEKLNSQLDLPRALIRGQFMAAIAQIEHYGIPIDTETLGQLKNHMEGIRATLIEDVDIRYNVFENGSFKIEKFYDWAVQNGINWPCLASGQLDLKKETFKQMSYIYPEVQPLRELRAVLSQLRSNSFLVGSDGRNRCMLSPFGTITSRNTPSSTNYIFGPAVLFRSLIKPDPGIGLAYIDYSKQEFAIAAVLSQDRNMIEAYLTGDPYLAFGKQIGVLPSYATKDSHPTERQWFKGITLGVNYGMGVKGLARKINQSELVAYSLLEKHKTTYKQFWKWSDAVRDFANLYGHLITNLGWKYHTVQDPNPRRLTNFPIQANGAEILRLAIILALERGVKVIAPVHDAILIEAPSDSLNDAIQTTKNAMAEASEIILNGFRINTDVKTILYPDRFYETRGVAMWNQLIDILNHVLSGDKIMHCKGP